MVVPAGQLEGDYMEIVADEAERRITEFSQQNLVSHRLLTASLHVCFP